MVTRSLADLSEEIEGLEFSAVLGASSNRAGFRYGLEKSTAFRDLLQVLSRTPSAAARAYNRVRELSRREVDVRYTNPYDVALATYISALNAAARPESELAASAILAARNAWRAREAAIEIDMHVPKPSEAENASSEAHGTPSVAMSSGPQAEHLFKAALVPDVVAEVTAWDPSPESDSTPMRLIFLDDAALPRIVAS